MEKFTELNLDDNSHGATSSELKVPLVWLEHARALCFQESVDLNFQLGPLHAINWAASLDFLPHLLELTCHVTGISQANFAVSPAFRYEDGRRVAKPGVGIFPRHDAAIPDEVLLEITAALTVFFHRVLEGQEISGQEQLFPLEISEKTNEVVGVLADKFLAGVSGKKVGEPHLLRTKNCEMLVAGAYRPTKDLPLPEPVRWTAVGEIDGLRGMTRTVFICTESRKTLAILFDEESFKKPLRDRLFDGSMYELIIETEWISPGKKIDRLVSIDSCDGAALDSPPLLSQL